MKLAVGWSKRIGYRLPSDAEWEYACRAGAVTSRYYGRSEELLDKYAWYTAMTKDERTFPAASLKPNDFGLFDMLGNEARGARTALNCTPGTGAKLIKVERLEKSNGHDRPRHAAVSLQQSRQSSPLRMP